MNSTRARSIVSAWALIVISVVILSAYPLYAQASFACAKATSPIEKLICSNKELADLDGALAKAYAKRRQELVTSRPSSSDALRLLLEDQRAWLKSRNTECQVPQTGVRLRLNKKMPPPRA